MHTFRCAGPGRVVRAWLPTPAGCLKLDRFVESLNLRLA
jgi:hypothetical protein